MVCLFFNRIVDDPDAGLAAPLVCYPDYPLSGNLSQRGLVDFHRHGNPVLFKIYLTAGHYAHLGFAGRISAPVCTSGSRIYIKTIWQTA